ncbi:DUF2336 domain-containing protein [Bradyrhizobium sp.]|jgi:hypothetical protein|uniref:DUF2336 domain-containing protein n=1 Tax=Bradyrhizobium sp. TaxID=376 RepID=UPI002D7ED4B6|nr:DUF2336 domain-containing protein [Bradyrhizobium sp.]
MTNPPPFPGFDGLMSLSRREGVDIRPTLLRVLTDLYVQASTHSEEEARQFVELTSRLIDQVDDATRAAVRARLAIYPGTPAPVLRQLRLRPADQPVSLAQGISADSNPADLPTPPSGAPGEAQLRLTSTLSMQPADAAELSAMFFGASSSERALILHNLSQTPLKASPRVPVARAERAIEALEMAAFVADVENFTLELSETLILPWKISTLVVNDLGGEPLACAAKALGMPSPVFQRVLLFLKPEIGTSVSAVYRLSRLFDILSERSALIMLAAWRGSTMAVARARYRPALYDDERNRARPAPGQTRSGPQLPGAGVLPRTGSQGSGR